MKNKEAKIILFLFIFCLVGAGFLYFFEHQGYAHPDPDSVTDYFDTTNPNNDPEYYIASKENLAVSGGQIHLESCLVDGEACSSDSACCSGICGTDADGDNYFSETLGHTGTCQTTGYPYTDCYDANSNAKPGQTSYFTSHRGDGSFDYNCDGTEEKQYTFVSTLSGTVCWGGCDSVMPTGEGGLWNAGAMENCGDEAFLQLCNSYGTTGCAGGYYQRGYKQGCALPDPWDSWCLDNSDDSYTQGCR